MQPLTASCLDPEQRRARMAAAFESLHGSPAQIAVRAPGRVDVMGSHTDYNEGSVLTLPIDRETWVFAAPREDDVVSITSLNLASSCEFSAANPNNSRVEGWGRYIQGVAVALQQAGYSLSGCDAVIHGTVPLNSGLSSSASLEAAVATMFEQLGSWFIDPVEKARLCQRAENQWVGVQCGILDQYSSILGEKGKALLLDCRSLTRRYADFPAALRVVVCNTCVPRQLTGSEYGERRAQCEQAAAFFAKLEDGIRTLRDVPLELYVQQHKALPHKTAMRARFIIEENWRVFELAGALQHDDHQAIGTITAASFMGARDLFDISVPAMQAMYDAMREAPGHVGSRQAGAGFGGCMVALVVQEQAEEFANHVIQAYRQATDITAEVYTVRIAAGAGVLRR